MPVAKKNFQRAAFYVWIGQVSACKDKHWHIKKEMGYVRAPGIE